MFKKYFLQTWQIEHYDNMAHTKNENSTRNSRTRHNEHQTRSFLYFNLIYLFQQMLSNHGMVNDF